MSKVKAAGRTPSQPPNAPVKFLNTITEPAGETGAKLIGLRTHRRRQRSRFRPATMESGADRYCRPFVSEHRQRAPPPNPIAPMARSRFVRRADEVERLPTKEIGSQRTRQRRR